MENLEQRVQKLEERNRRVEQGKAWETSGTRRLLLAVLTYLAIAIYLWAVGISRPWLHAIVPAIAFTISTLAMPWLKRIWIKNIYK